MRISILFFITPIFSCAAFNLPPSDHRVAITCLGTRIPYSALESFQAEVSQHFVHNHVYELTNDYRLIGSNLNEDLRSLRVSHFISAQDQPPVRIDGRLVRLPTEATVRVGSRFAAIVDNHDHEILLIWGNNINLVPIGSRLPNIFVNTARHPELSNLTENIEVTNLKPTNTHSVAPLYIPVSLTGDQSLHRAHDIPRFTSRANYLKNAPCSDKYPRKTVEIAIAFGSFFCKKYNGNSTKAVSVLRALTLAGSVPYEDQTCLKLSAVHFDGYCDETKDPYVNYAKFPAPEQVLKKFASFWHVNRKDVHRDVAYFFQGHNANSELLGVASVGGACAPDRAYGIVSFPDPLVFAHEVAHNLGCQHSNYGIMRSYYGSGLKPKFQPVSLWQMFNFVDKQPFLSSCLRNLGPTPTPHAISTGRKCNTGFSMKKALLCRTFNLGKIRAPLGFAKISVKIAYNVVEVQIYVTYKQVVIHLIKSFVSLRGDLSIAEVGRLFTFNNGARLVRQKWTMSDMYIPKNTNSCCGAKYYVYVWTYLCSKISLKCRYEYLIKTFVLQCKDLCEDQKADSLVLPMANDRKCPACKVRS